VSSPYVIVLSEAEEAVLSASARWGRSAYRGRLRAQIVLAAAAGPAGAGIASELGVCTRHGVHDKTIWRDGARALSALRAAGTGYLAAAA
jgi:hypothetical protein